MIPLIKNLDVNEINTSLIAIRKLLNNAGITETNITNIIGKDYDAKIQELEEKVEADDTYSTTEVKTNKKWIDGKPIYSKTISVNISLGSAGQWYNTNVKIPNVDTSISCSNFVNDSSYPTKLIRSSVPGMFATNASDDVMIHSFHVTGTLKYATLEYTKTTD